MTHQPTDTEGDPWWWM